MPLFVFGFTVMSYDSGNIQWGFSIFADGNTGGGNSADDLPANAPAHIHEASIRTEAVAAALSQFSLVIDPDDVRLIGFSIS